MENFITEIRIKNIYHLSNIDIKINSEKRQNLMITGKNGSGKTSLLLAIQKYFEENNFDKEKNSYTESYERIFKYFLCLIENAEKHDIQFPEDADIKKIFEKHKDKNAVELKAKNWQKMNEDYVNGEFIIAFFPADRKLDVLTSTSAEDIKFNKYYAADNGPGNLLQKYMVHLKTQQAYARNEGDLAIVEKIQKWFERFTNALRVLLDDESITLKYNYKKYDFEILEKGRKPFGFNSLSDGYSSVLYIVADLILRMDHNWLLNGELSEYDVEGIVLIDELETHLHIELQKKIMPFLTEFFPRIQFIVTTHSPYILNSISNAKVYDLERCVEMENLSAYSSESLAEGYFGADEYSDELKRKLERYQVLKEKTEPTDDERAECAELRIELKNIPKTLSPEAWERFEEIEGGKTW